MAIREMDEPGRGTVLLTKKEVPDRLAANLLAILSTVLYSDTRTPIKGSLPGPSMACRSSWGPVHGFANHGAVDAKTLTTMSPAVIGPEFFREMAVVIDAAEGSPPDRAKMVEIMRRYGLTPVPPPSA